jgi:hypothetical protein
MHFKIGLHYLKKLIFWSVNNRVCNFLANIVFFTLCVCY